tara:strand:+ start:2980 stop:3249 length:270 start_codon:yes stop_codon:yes gene_type:complete
MSKNVKLEGENVKELTFEVKDLNLDKRIEFNNIITKSGGISNIGFGDWVNMIRIATTLTDDDINQFTDTEVISVANRCYEVVNKKKLKK